MLDRVTTSLRVRGVFGSLEAARVVLAARIRRLCVGVEDRWYCRRGLSRSGLRALIEAGAFRDSTILTAKFDAFGGRFGDILNGWRVAQALGAEYRFYWPERALPGIRSAADVFSEDFVAKHALESVRLSQYRVVRFFRLRDLAAMTGRNVVLWYQSKSDELGAGKFNVATRGFKIPGLMTHGEAFAQIPLSPRLAAVREQTRSLPPFDIAVHVRRGDIYEGDFRLGGSFTNKALPLPVVERILAGLEPGSRVLLVGNDLERVRSRLSGDVMVHVPSEFSGPLPSGSDIDDFFDFCLLARSRRLVAGHSVFALIPSRIAGVRLELPTDLVSREELIDALLRFVRAAPRAVDLEVALACEYVRSEYQDCLSETVLDELVEISRFADPSNPVYALRGFALAERRHDTSAATEALRSAAEQGVPELCVRLLRQELDLHQGVGFSRIWTGFLTAEDRSTLMSSVDDYEWAAFYAGVDLASQREFTQAHRILQRPSSLSTHPAYIDVARIIMNPPISPPKYLGGSLITPTEEEVGEVESVRGWLRRFRSR